MIYIRCCTIGFNNLGCCITGSNNSGFCITGMNNTGCCIMGIDIIGILCFSKSKKSNISVNQIFNLPIDSSFTVIKIENNDIDIQIDNIEML